MTLAPAYAGCHCARPGDFVLQRWPDGVVVYDDANASLHALNLVAGEAFELLLNQSEATDARALAYALVQTEPTEEDVELVASLLAQFESMGLIECTQTR